MKEIQGALSTNQVIPLYQLPIGKAAIVKSITAEGITKRRMQDLGLVPGTRIEALRVSPAGDPKAFKIRGAVIAFRKEESIQIIVNYKED